MKRFSGHVRGLVWVVLLCAVLTGAPAAGDGSKEPVRVVLSPGAQVGGHLIRLAHIGWVESAPEGLTRALEDLTVGIAPALCQETLLHADLVRDRLREVLPDQPVVVSGADIVRVARVCRRLSGDELGRVGIEFIRSHMRWNEADVRIDNVQVSEALVPDMPFRFEVSASSREDFLGPVTLSIRIRGNEGFSREVRWQGKVSVYVDCPVAARPLRRNEVLRPDDLRMEKRNLADLHGPVVRAMEEAVGNRVSRSIPAGDVLTAKDLDRPLWVRRGDVVTLVARSGFLTVTTKGKAQDSGSEGDMVRVRNVRSNKEVAGRVVGRGTVQVAF